MAPSSPSATIAAPVKPRAMGLFFNPAKLYPPSRTKELVLTVQHVEGKGREAQLITQNVLLHQGLNLVEPEKIALVQGGYPDHVSRGAVEVIDLKDTVGTGAALVLKNLGALSDDQATKAVGFERDRAVLNSWLATEPRPAVVRAINERISSLEKGATL
jgi:hypothetical protein